MSTSSAKVDVGDSPCNDTREQNPNNESERLQSSVLFVDMPCKSCGTMFKKNTILQHVKQNKDCSSAYSKNDIAKIKKDNRRTKQRTARNRKSKLANTNVSSENVEISSNSSSKYDESEVSSDAAVLSEEEAMSVSQANEDSHQTTNAIIAEPSSNGSSSQKEVSKAASDETAQIDNVAIPFCEASEALSDEHMSETMEMEVLSEEETMSVTQNNEDSHQPVNPFDTEDDGNDEDEDFSDENNEDSDSSLDDEILCFPCGKYWKSDDILWHIATPPCSSWYGPASKDYLKK